MLQRRLFGRRLFHRRLTTRRLGLFIGLIASGIALSGCGLLGGGTATNVTPPPSGLSARIVDASLQTADGLTRTYRLFLPSALNVPNPKPLPLLIALHGGFGAGSQFENNSGFDAVAAKEQFIVAYPDGIGVGGTNVVRTWNGGRCCGPAARKNVNDVAFISQLIDTVQGQYPVDSHRVFAAGHSNGGIMSYRLACELSNKIVGIGVQSGTLMLTPCNPALPVSVIDIQGSADQNVPIGGGVGPRGVSGANFLPPIDAVTTLARADGCPANPTKSVRIPSGLPTGTWP